MSNRYFGIGQYVRLIDSFFSVWRNHFCVFGVDEDTMRQNTAEPIANAVFLRSKGGRRRTYGIMTNTALTGATYDIDGGQPFVAA